MPIRFVAELVRVQSADNAQSEFPRIQLPPISQLSTQYIPTSRSRPTARNRRPWALPMLRFLSVMICVVFASSAFAENWPGWRGPTGLGQSSARELPLPWSDKENIRWKAPLPDTGNASPAVWGDHIFLTQATNKGTKR